jgi:hypothetical protein
VQAADYLLKPVRANRLADAITRVANRLPVAVSANATIEQIPRLFAARIFLFLSVDVFCWFRFVMFYFEGGAEIRDFIYVAKEFLLEES